MTAHGAPPRAKDHHLHWTPNRARSLAESMAAQRFDSVPDTLEVHSDSVAVMQDSVRAMRRPALLAAAAVGAVIVGIVVLGILGRAGRGETQPPLA